MLARGRTVILVSLTGLIYGGIVVLWLCYLVPLALRRYDDASRARSVERFSTAMRVLGREERPVPAGSTRLRTRAAARQAAQRRRRVLLVLLVLTGAVAGVCLAGLTPWWAMAAPVVLVVGFLVLARVQVTQVRGRTWEQQLVTALNADSARLVEPVGDEPDNAPTVVLDTVAAGAPATSPDDQPEEHQQLMAAAVVTSDGGSLWDPVPVTLPTYVSKPRATRSVRTVDLGGPGAWTSGRLTAEQSQQVREAETAQAGAAQAGREVEPARAVGD